MRNNMVVLSACKFSVLLGSGIALGLLSVPMVSVAASLAQRNPEPGIFQEPPYNRTPPPATTPSVPESQVQIQPEPEPNASVTIAGERVTIQLVNQTGAEISYQVVGDTEFRTLAGRETVTLRDLPVPTTLTFRRQDQGLLSVTLQPDNPVLGTLVLNLDETTDFAADRTTLNVNEAGEVFLN
jgi:hypothetical protein